MKKFLNPRVLAISSTILLSLFMVICLYLNGHRINSVNPYDMTQYMYSVYTEQELFFIVWFLFILFKKNGKMRILNILLLIANIICIFASICPSVIAYCSISRWSNIIEEPSVIRLIIKPVLEIIILLGIILRLKLPYKFLSGGLIIAIIVGFIYNMKGALFYEYYGVSRSLILITTGILYSLAYICVALFLYLYSKNIKERIEHNG